MNCWFIFLLVIVALETGIVIAKHGEPRKGNYSFGTQLISASLLIFVVFKAIQTGF